MPRLERTTFEASRAAEFFDARKLATLTGVGSSEFSSVVLKELIDNSLDACETAAVQPRIDVEVEGSTFDFNITVQDNGPGIPSDVVRKVLDYSISVSDKAAYRSPTRGAQGNAWKTIVGIPYSLGSRKPLRVFSREGVEHIIKPSIDPAGKLRIAHEEANGAAPEIRGSRVEIPISLAVDTFLPQDFDPLHWVRRLQFSTPMSTSLIGVWRPVRRSRFLQIHRRAGEKVRAEPTYLPTGTLPESLKALIFSHIAHAEAGGEDLPLGKFVRQFAGLSSTAKAKAVTAARLRSSISPTSRGMPDSWPSPREHAGLEKAPKAAISRVMWGGPLSDFFQRIYVGLAEFKYKRVSSTLPRGSRSPSSSRLLRSIPRGRPLHGSELQPVFG